MVGSSLRKLFHLMFSVLFPCIVTYSGICRNEQSVNQERVRSGPDPAEKGPPRAQDLPTLLAKVFSSTYRSKLAFTWLPIGSQ